jgi:hypothetical protein
MPNFSSKRARRLIGISPALVKDRLIIGCGQVDVGDEDSRGCLNGTGKQIAHG